MSCMKDWRLSLSIMALGIPIIITMFFMANMMTTLIEKVNQMNNRRLKELIQRQVAF